MSNCIMVGGAYQGSAPEIADAARAGGRRKRIQRDILAQCRVSTMKSCGNFYRECDFTVYASRIEGFRLAGDGESLNVWQAVPLLGRGSDCRECLGGRLPHGEYARSKGAGGWPRQTCKPVSPALRRELGEQVLRRKLKSWDEYAGEILQISLGRFEPRVDFSRAVRRSICLNARFRGS